MMLEKVLAALVLLVCVMAIVRGALSTQRRQQWDRFALRTWGVFRRAGHNLLQRIQQVWQHLRSRRGQRGAEQEAHAAIERARRTGLGADAGAAAGRDNVIRPQAFERKAPPGDKLH